MSPIACGGPASAGLRHEPPFPFFTSFLFFASRSAIRKGSGCRSRVVSRTIRSAASRESPWPTDTYSVRELRGGLHAYPRTTPSISRGIAPSRRLRPGAGRPRRGCVATPIVGRPRRGPARGHMGVLPDVCRVDAPHGLESPRVAFLDDAAGQTLLVSAKAPEESDVREGLT